MIKKKNINKNIAVRVNMDGLTEKLHEFFRHSDYVNLIVFKS